MLIRYLIDNYSRSETFFTVKNLMLDRWLKIESKVILALMNKTRKQIKVEE